MVCSFSQQSSIQCFFFFYIYPTVLFLSYAFINSYCTYVETHLKMCIFSLFRFFLSQWCTYNVHIHTLLSLTRFFFCCQQKSKRERGRVVAKEKTRGKNEMRSFTLSTSFRERVKILSFTRVDSQWRTDCWHINICTSSFLHFDVPSSSLLLPFSLTLSST